MEDMCKVKESEFYRDILVNVTYNKLRKENIKFVVYLTECIRNKAQYLMRGYDDLRIKQKYSNHHDIFCILNMKNFRNIMGIIGKNKRLLNIKMVFRLDPFTPDPEYIEYIKE
jgi:hypothetical protein